MGEVDYYMDKFNVHPIIKKHENILIKLSNERVMCVEYDESGKFYIVEYCDEWFSHLLTKADCIELAEMFNEIACEITEC